MIVALGFLSLSHLMEILELLLSLVYVMSLSDRYLSLSSEFWDHKVVPSYPSYVLLGIKPKLSTHEANILSTPFGPNDSHFNRDFSGFISYVIWYLGYSNL